MPAGGNLETLENTLYYCATPPALYGTIAQGLYDVGLVRHQTRDNAGIHQIAFEKPFGNSQRSAEDLWTLLSQLHSDDQIVFIDHYRYKAAIKNLLSLRQELPWLDELWNSEHIDHVQITVAEAGGIGKDVATYNEIGAIRDMVQNHLFEMICTVASDLPLKGAKQNTQDEGIKVLDRLQPWPSYEDADIEDWLVLGQHDGSEYGEIKEYTKEFSTSPREYQDSKPTEGRPEVETFVAMRLKIDNERWAGVPFYLRTGKWMSAKTAAIIIQFKEFGRLVVRVQPDHRIIVDPVPDVGPLTLITSSLGPSEVLRLEEDQSRRAIDAERKIKPRSDYAHDEILKELINGELKRRVSYKWIDSAWEVIDKIREDGSVGKQYDAKIRRYRPGTRGPKQADDLVKVMKHQWATLVDMGL